MDSIFLKVVNMSTGAGYVIAAVLIARLLLRRAPKIYSYLLWAVVGFRLCCPFSFRSVFSLFSVKPLQSTLSSGSGADGPVFFPDVYNALEHVVQEPQNAMNYGVIVMDPAGGTLPGSGTSFPADIGKIAVSTHTFMDAAVIVWLLGIAALLIYVFISYLYLHRKLRTAVRMKDNVWQSDQVKSPFILGIIRPKIYIPFGLSEEALSYVLTHEHIHLQRKDHLVKAFACITLSVHWFNPMVWLAFRLMNKDMEMSCDERVLKEMDTGSGDEKKGYSMSLLAFAADRRFYAPGPLAFGEAAVKSRIKNVLRWKKPGQLVTVCALVLCLAVTVACAANPPGEEEQQITGNVAAEVWGYRITDDWLAYRAAVLQAVGHESPVDGALEAVMKHLWLDSKVVYEDVTQAEIDAYVKRTVEAFDSMSEDEKDAYFAALGFTYEEWKNHYLPQYDARAVLVAEKAEQRAAELEDESLLDVDFGEMNLEITDTAAVEMLRQKYPGIQISFDEIEDAVQIWAKEENVRDYEICSTITSATGKTKQVYLKTVHDETLCYVWLVLEKQADGTWASAVFSKKTLSEASADLNRTKLTVLSEGEDNVTACAFQNLCLFPEADRSNFGVVEIDRTEGNESVGLNLHQGLQVNQIDGPGPGFRFKADMKNPEQPVITMSQFPYHTPSDSGAMQDVIPELYYGKFEIPVERLREMAMLLYEYVPLYAEMNE